MSQKLLSVHMCTHQWQSSFLLLVHSTIHHHPRELLWTVPATLLLLYKQASTVGLFVTVAFLFCFVPMYLSFCSSKGVVIVIQGTMCCCLVVSSESMQQWRWKCVLSLTECCDCYTGHHVLLSGCKLWVGTAGKVNAEYMPVMLL